MWLKRVFKDLIRSAGYDLITEETSREYLLAGNLRELFRRFDIQLTFDVGANEGQYFRFIRDQVGFSGRVVSFEPNPALAARLSDRAKADPKWEVMGLALGSKAGRMAFNIAAESQVSSFLAFAENTRHVAVTSVQEVMVETLDNIGDRLLGPVPIGKCFLKLDTQGFDVEVMKGASRYLRHIPFFTTEIPVIHIYEGMTSFSDHLKFVIDQGFAVAGMGPTSRDSLFRAREFDCLFVNERLAAERAGR